MPGGHSSCPCCRAAPELQPQAHLRAVKNINSVFVTCSERLEDMMWCEALKD